MIRHFPRTDRVARLAVPLAPRGRALHDGSELDQGARTQRAVLTRKLTTVAQRALRCLLAEELASKPEHIFAVVDRELSAFKPGARLELHVSPADGQRLRAALSGIETPTWSLTVIDDPDVRAGGFRVRGSVGEVDALIETRLEALDALIAEELSGL